MKIAVRVVKDSEMEPNARVSEQDLARLRVGQPAEVTPVGTTTGFEEWIAPKLGRALTNDEQRDPGRRLAPQPAE